MFLQQHHPLLHKILTNWPSDPERPPLLINGISENKLESIRKDIIKIFTEKPIISGHPDILTLERDPKKQNIEVQQTRDFISQLSLSHYELPFKLGFIPAAHQLNIQSQNALLKTLEEPLKNRYLIMGTVSKNKLLPTILSRSTIINLDHVVETGHAPSLQKEIFEFYENCLKSSAEKRLQKGQIWSEGKTEKINDFFESIVLELHKKMKDNIKGGNLKTAQILAGQLKKALDYFEQLQTTSGASPKLLFEAFLLQVQ